MNTCFCLNIGIVGSSNAGKSALIQREVEDTFQQNKQNRIGQDSKVKYYSIGQTNTKGQIWNPNYGRQIWKPRLVQFLNRCHAIGICFSLYETTTFKEIDFQMRKAIKDKNKPIWLIGCKADLQHTVTNQQIKKRAIQSGFKYIQTSARLNTGIKQLFIDMVSTALEIKKIEDNQGQPLKSVQGVTNERCELI